MTVTWHNLGFFVDLKAPGDSPYSQLQFGAIKTKKGSAWAKLFTIPPNTHPPTSWVTHAVLSTSIALSLSLGTAILVEGTRQTASLVQSPHADWKGCTCLLICCVLTPLVLARWSVIWLWNIGNSNKYKTLTVVTILGMDSTDIQWLLMGILPNLLITIWIHIRKEI